MVVDSLERIKMELELSTPIETVLNEINVLRLPQKEVAKTCAILIMSRKELDWTEINKAIVARWSKSARERVLGMAWKMIEKKSFDI